MTTAEYGGKKIGGRKYVRGGTGGNPSWEGVVDHSQPGCLF